MTSAGSSLRVAAMCFVALAAALPAAAQDFPRSEFSAGYQMLRLSVDGESETLGKGWYVDVASNINRMFGGVFEVGGSYKSLTETTTSGGFTGTATADFKIHEIMGGLRVNSRGNPNVVPFAQVLAGLIHGSASATVTAGTTGSPVFSDSFEDSGSNFGLQIGGGVNMAMTRRLGLRVGVDYLRVFEEGGGGNAFRFGAGVVVH